MTEENRLNAFTQQPSSYQVNSELGNIFITLLLWAILSWGTRTGAHTLMLVTRGTWDPHYVKHLGNTEPWEIRSGNIRVTLNLSALSAWANSQVKAYGCNSRC